MLCLRPWISGLGWFDLCSILTGLTCAVYTGLTCAVYTLLHIYCADLVYQHKPGGLLFIGEISEGGYHSSR